MAMFTTWLSSRGRTRCTSLRRHSRVSLRATSDHFTSPASECSIQIAKDPFLLLRLTKYAWLASKTRRGLKGPQNSMRVVWIHLFAEEGKLGIPNLNLF
ncbi:hypothetical protein CEXT_706411 [Caerostris extrusa]|uniref:Uncharacterized protein n=1 Tax=Caerostris extrusa TaxID=172846 RepID=A0AAV4QC25_CAEEX|nr:hypothetical protein CEXT_706411 [Caerostris extrusa]